MTLNEMLDLASIGPVTFEPAVYDTLAEIQAADQGMNCA